MKINNEKLDFLELTQDIVFKSFFSRDEQVLISLLKSFLPLRSEIESIKILNLEEKDKVNNKKTSQSKALAFKETALYSDNLNKKQVFLDLRLKLSTGENINVEMQAVRQKYFLKRILFYWSKLYSKDLGRGEDYRKVRPAYSLIFTTFSVLDYKIKDFMSSFSIRRDKQPHQLFNEDLKIVIVELSKLKKGYKELLDLKEKWCYILRESSNITREEYKSLSRNEDMKMVLKHLNELSRDEQLRESALTRQMNKVAYDLDRAGLLEEGMQKGMQEGVKQVALNMLKAGSEISFVSKVTGLSKEEIASLEK